MALTNVCLLLHSDLTVNRTLAPQILASNGKPSRIKQKKVPTESGRFLMGTFFIWFFTIQGQGKKT